MRKICSLLLALLIVASLAVPAFATSKDVDDPGTVNFGVGRTKDVVITPDLGAKTSTDLFGNFKGVMPGDTLTEMISIRNWALQYDYIKVYLQAKPHDEDNEPKIGNKHDAEFLSQLELKVTNGDEVIYHAGPNEDYQLDEAGELKDAKYLGKLTRKNSIDALDLKVELMVPVTMDNEFADAMGEVDWVFLFEGHNYPKDNPKTGDYIITGAVALLAISGAALLILFFMKKKKKK